MSESLDEPAPTLIRDLDEPGVLLKPEIFAP
jgi:hypothetical protein